jgi:hypothetical protein
MPKNVQWACILILLSLLQGIFNLRYLSMETLLYSSPNIIGLSVLFILLAGMVLRQAWACWGCIFVTVAGVLLLGVSLAGIGFHAAGTAYQYLASALQLTPVRAALQVIAVILLLSSTSRPWFRERRK